MCPQRAHWPMRSPGTPASRPASWARYRPVRSTVAPSMSSQYIFTMHRLSRRFPPDKTVLQDVNLSFYPGAKIGVLGYNGAGKSTVLRIMAGVDQDYQGDARLAPGATVGMLEQEPHLDEAKDVRGNVEDGIREVRDLMEDRKSTRLNSSHSSIS